VTTTGLEREIEYLVDINPHKAGKFLPGTGHAVVSPETLRDYRPEIVLAMNPVYTNEIRASLAAMGVSAEVIPV
jgi:hypothetical protein